MMDFNRLSFKLIMWLGAILALLLLTAPTLVILLASFSSGETLKFPPPGLSFRWYISLLELPELFDAFWNSIWVAMLTMILSLLLGVSAALPLSTRQSPWTQAIEALIMSPLALPALSVGLALLLFFNLIGWSLSITTLMISHVILGVPYLVRTTLASLSQISPGLREASASLGADPFRTFRCITLPLAQQGIIAGCFITFLTSFDNITVSLLLSDARTQVLPVRMWSLIQNNLDVRAASISAILIVGTAILMLVMERIANLSKFVVGDK